MTRAETICLLALAQGCTTGEIVEPPSVTKHTTHMLDR
jgi:hypothetical protein